MDTQLGAFTVKQWLILLNAGALLALGLITAGYWWRDFRRARRAGSGFMTALSGISRKAALPIAGGVAGIAASDLDGQEPDLGADWSGGAGVDCGGCG